MTLIINQQNLCKHAYKRTLYNSNDNNNNINSKDKFRKKEMIILIKTNLMSYAKDLLIQSQIP